MQEREREKAAKYVEPLKQMSRADGVVYHFNAFVVSVHGDVGDRARFVLGEIADYAKKNSFVIGDEGEEEFFKRAERRIAAAALGNARIDQAFLRQERRARGGLAGEEE